jgi:cation-transporting ATPase E
MAVIQGLSESEALARRQHGDGNDIRLQTSRSYRDILRQNLFAFINIVLFGIGAVLILIGRFEDAVLSVLLILMNIIIGVYQEVRAKRQLDRIALLTRPKVAIVRDGQEKTVDPSEIVLGDVLVARPGDQIVADGVLVGDGEMEVDESLLTGESDLIPKHADDNVLSGSFCVSGSAMYKATKVGLESYANQLTAGARSFRLVQTPLQKDVDFIIRLLTLLAIFIGLLLLISAVLLAIPLMRSVQMAAVIAGLVPNGLFLMLIVAYAMGALRIVGRGALVQQSNSVESLSYVDVLCMDKTGTITTNRIRFHEIEPIGVGEQELINLLGDFANSTSVSNRTNEAIIVALGGQKRHKVDEIPFSSARKWSALAFDDEILNGTYALGAFEALQPYLHPGYELSEKIEAWSKAGLRVLLFTHHADVISLHDSEGDPHLPKNLVPLGLLSFLDELRPALKETLEGFTEAGIHLKVISGDHPYTVTSLIKQAGLPADLEAVVSGSELEDMDDTNFNQVAEKISIFGRIMPEQKERLVEALREGGHYVAMIGDGVNDVLSLKKANLGIAMQSGSAATRAVADMILLNDSFGALPPAFMEGQRIINGMRDILRLFLTRAIYFAMLIIATAVIGIGFPYVPKHATLVTLFTVGIPTFALAAWARPGNVPKEGLMRAVTHFVFPAAISTFLFGLIIYTTAFGLAYRDAEARSFTVTQEEIDRFRISAGIDYEITAPEDYASELATLVAQSALTTFTLLAGLVLVVFVEPPTEFFVGGDIYSGDKRPTLLVVGLLLASLAVMIIEPIRTFFEVLVLPPFAYLIIGVAVVLWAFVLRQTWRLHWFERFLRLESVR